jgi:hypothetical protein
MNTASASLASHGREQFPELSTRELKGLFNNHSSITALSVLWSLGAALVILLSPLLMLGVIGFEEGGAPGFLIGGGLLAVGVFQLITVIGCFRRTEWARVCGIIVSALMLVNLPIGPIFGVLGLYAFIKGGRLFGPDRYEGRELKVELKRRKKLKVA